MQEYERKLINRVRERVYGFQCMYVYFRRLQKRHEKPFKSFPHSEQFSDFFSNSPDDTFIFPRSLQGPFQNYFLRSLLPFSVAWFLQHDITPQCGIMKKMRFRYKYKVLLRYENTQYFWGCSKHNSENIIINISFYQCFQKKRSSLLSVFFFVKIRVFILRF